MNRKVVMLLAVLALMATPAAAEKGQKGDWELGAYGGIGYPDSYEPDSGPALNPQDGWLWGARFGYFITSGWGIEGSIQRFGSRTDYDQSLGLENDDFDIRSYRLNVLYNFMPSKSFRPFITAGLGREITGGGAQLTGNDLGMNVGGGVRWYLGKTFGVRLDARLDRIQYDSDNFSSQNNLELTLGVLWSFGGEPATPPADSDGDGVSDKKDKCPNTPSGARVDPNGCPIDTDGDGVPDGIDACPDSPKGSKVDATGCPPDSDKDGVTDDKDACPGTPQGATVDARGCPKDSDGDGVFDYLDKCPNTLTGTKVDASGCPLPPPPPPPAPEPTAEATRMFNGVLEGVDFATNKSDLTLNAKTILNGVVQTLGEWPDVKVEVGGYTDTQGDETHNQKLSQARAESVMKYLISKGIDPSRLTAKGYGEANPIADNTTAAGRAKNRRVELKQTH
jgi:OmpA-OmpF porin, OOP family